MGVRAPSPGPEPPSWTCGPDSERAPLVTFCFAPAREPAWSFSGLAPIPPHFRSRNPPVTFRPQVVRCQLPCSPCLRTCSSFCPGPRQLSPRPVPSALLRRPLRIASSPSPKEACPPLLLGFFQGRSCLKSAHVLACVSCMSRGLSAGRKELLLPAHQVAPGLGLAQGCPEVREAQCCLVGRLVARPLSHRLPSVLPTAHLLPGPGGCSPRVLTSAPRDRCSEWAPLCFSQEEVFVSVDWHLALLVRPHQCTSQDSGPVTLARFGTVRVDSWNRSLHSFSFLGVESWKG